MTRLSRLFALGLGILIRTLQFEAARAKQPREQECLEVTVMNEAGRSYLPHRMVDVTDASMHMDSVRADRLGRARFYNLRPGRWLVRVQGGLRPDTIFVTTGRVVRDSMWSRPRNIPPALYR